MDGEQVSELKIELASTKEESKLQMQELWQLRAVNEATKKEIDRCISEQVFLWRFFVLVVLCL